jgi:hypothetical protein
MSIQKVNDCYALKSYSTIIGLIKPNGDCYITDRTYSVTTSKHQGIFCRIFGGKYMDSWAFNNLLDKSISGNGDVYGKTFRYPNNFWNEDTKSYILNRR